jgi:hypothetical protein
LPIPRFKILKHLLYLRENFLRKICRNSDKSCPWTHFQYPLGFGHSVRPGSWPRLAEPFDGYCLAVGSSGKWRGILGVGLERHAIDIILMPQIVPSKKDRNRHGEGPKNRRARCWNAEQSDS